MAEKVVKALVVRLLGKDMKLTIAEAKKLYDALGEIFDRPVVTVESPRPWPYPVYPRPYVWWSSGDLDTGGSFTLTMNVEPDLSQTAEHL